MTKLVPLLILTVGTLAGAACSDDGDMEFSGGGAGGSAGAAGSSGGGKSAGGTGGKAQGGSNSGGNGTGGAAVGGGTGGEPGGGASSGGEPGGGAAGDNAGGTAGDSSGGASSGGANDGGSPGSGGGGRDNCPSAIFGDYEITSAVGTCGTLDVDAAQSIDGTAIACAAHFVSVGDGPDGVNGGADLDEDGNFSGAMLYLDATQRNPCSGAWDAEEQTMMIECGGQGDLCTVVLTRSN